MHDGQIVARELVLAEEVANLELDEFEELGIVDRVDLVEEHDDVRHLHLAGQEDVLAGLGHGPVGGGDHEDRAVHLRRAGDHVLDVVGVAGAVDVGIVAVVVSILEVGDGDGDVPRALLGRVVDESNERYSASPLQREVLRDGRRQRRLSVVYVTDRADVDVGLGALELLSWPSRALSTPQVAERTARMGTGAHNRVRTDDLFLTKEVLCRLSYVGSQGFAGGQERNSNLYSRRRLIYSQLSSPPAQPTHGRLRPRDHSRLSEEASNAVPLRMEPTTGLEPGTGGLQNRCSTN